MWKFETRNLGKVRHAEISMAPLVMFLGKNNTGKSYVAMLAWALTNAQQFLNRQEARERRPDWFAEVSTRIENAKPVQMDITASHAKDLLAYFNSELAHGAGELLREAFAYNGFGDTFVRTEAAEPYVNFSFSVTPFESTEGEKRPIGFTFRIIESGGAIRRINLPGVRTRAEFVTNRVFYELLGRALLGQQRHRNTLYVPAARTGLILALRSIISQSLEGEPTLSRSLPRPLNDFLRRLAVPLLAPDRKNSMTEIADWLEKEVMHGEIEMTDDEVPSFAYIPENTKTSLPLHVASSMITELAPILILLRQGVVPRQIIFEEPEAHLHLAAQRSIARALARLINAGVHVLVTSHSDTFVQQINNLMHLHSHPHKEQLMQELRYDQSDLIDPEKARAYEFIEDLGQTVVAKCKKEPEGFVVTSLNDTLRNLATETIALQDEEE